jgi:hypothetical protein
LLVGVTLSACPDLEFCAVCIHPVFYVDTLER